MKELSIEEKAEAYDKVSKEVKDFFEGKQKMNSDVTQTLKYLFPELADSEDEKTKESLMQYIWDIYHREYCPPTPSIEICDKWLTWLEKQKYTQRDIDDAYLKGICDAKQELEKQGEQKPPVIDFNANDWYVSKVDGKIHNIYYSVDKIEPKFKVGDYIVSDYCMGRVVEITNDAYLLDTEQGIPFSCRSIRLWDITKDAKDGDVLVVPSIEGSEHSEQIFIFKEIKDRDYVKNAVEYYCRVFDNEFWLNERGFMGQSDDYFVPATKEQRDLLFKKMKDANYRWDAEKKELKLLITNGGDFEPKQEWSEEDMSKVQRICKYLDEAKKYYADITEVRECVNWLKSLEDKIKEK